MKTNDKVLSIRSLLWRLMWSWKFWNLTKIKEAISRPHYSQIKIMVLDPSTRLYEPFKLFNIPNNNALYTNIKQDIHENIYMELQMKPLNLEHVVIWKKFCLQKKFSEKKISSNVNTACFHHTGNWRTSAKLNLKDAGTLASVIMLKCIYSNKVGATTLIKFVLS